LKNNPNIAIIVRQATRNNSKAQCELYTMFHQEMLGLCIRMVANKQVAEDILQDSFVKAFTRIRQLKEQEKFGVWFKRIVVNECIKFLKSIEYFEALENINIYEDEDTEDWYKTISFEEINNEIDLLPNGCRQILVLYLIENLKHKEIADLLKISVSTSKSQYHYALNILKKKLKEKFE
jgi:RNA polymerase sigma-70 factor (ECF subfamily)